MKSVDIPRDADGDAIRRVLNHGSDPSRPMKVDFAVAVPDQAAGIKIADIVSARGYSAEISFDEASEAWTCLCSKEMLLTHEGLIAAQKELATIAHPFDSFPDGWGTFGNANPKG